MLGLMAHAENEQHLQLDVHLPHSNQHVLLLLLNKKQACGDFRKD